MDRLCVFLKRICELPIWSDFGFGLINFLEIGILYFIFSQKWGLFLDSLSKSSYFLWLMMGLILRIILKVLVLQYLLLVSYFFFVPIYLNVLLDYNQPQLFRLKPVWTELIRGGNFKSSKLVSSLQLVSFTIMTNSVLRVILEKLLPFDWWIYIFHFFRVKLVLPPCSLLHFDTYFTFCHWNHPINWFKRVFRLWIHQRSCVGANYFGLENEVFQSQVSAWLYKIFYCTSKIRTSATFVHLIILSFSMFEYFLQSVCKWWKKWEEITLQICNLMADKLNN